jgi:predicted lipoprotein with Yx(FWY)xxD motif
MFKHSVIALLTGLSLGAPIAVAQTGQPAQVADTSKGKALVDSRGMTLYTFDRDASGKSNCSGQCAQNWPPFMATSASAPSGDWTVVTREDGSRQWAYKGKPLYTWVRDSKPGDATGDGVNNVWHVAKP